MPAAVDFGAIQAVGVDWITRAVARGSPFVAHPPEVPPAPA